MALKDIVNYQYNNQRIYDQLENYIYFYHTDTLLVLPVFPENISDTTAIQVQDYIPLSRSAPIYSYSGSGPRSIQFSFKIHRDMMKQVNRGVSNVSLNEDDDYVDAFIKCMQSAAVPNYAASTKMIDPPVVSVKLVDSVFIKGVITGNVGVTWELPVLRDNKYCMAQVIFSVSEIQPYDAQQIMNIGSYRDSGDMPISTSLSGSSFIIPNASSKSKVRA